MSLWPLEGNKDDPPQVSVQKQGRFEVYEGDAAPVSPPQANGASLMEKHLAKPGTPDPNRCFAVSDGGTRFGTPKAGIWLECEV